MDLPLDKDFNGPELDQPDFIGTPRCYIVASSPRSGSTLLCRMLARTRQMGVPHEYFHLVGDMHAIMQRWEIKAELKSPPTNKNVEDYLKRLKRSRTTPNGVFGMKMHYRHLVFLLKSGFFDGHFPDVEFIYIRRRDLVRQAVSLAMATQTHKYHSFQKDKNTPLHYNPARIDHFLNFILNQQAHWSRFFEIYDILPLEVVYEDFLTDYLKILTRACTLVGEEVDINWSLDEVGLVPFDSELKEEWTARYKAEQRIV